MLLWTWVLFFRLLTQIGFYICQFPYTWWHNYVFVYCESIMCTCVCEISKFSDTTDIFKPHVDHHHSEISDQRRRISRVLEVSLYIYIYLDWRVKLSWFFNLVGLALHPFTLSLVSHMRTQPPRLQGGPVTGWCSIMRMFL